MRGLSMGNSGFLILRRKAEENLPILLLATFCVAIALIASPPILGLWEGSVVFRSFAPEDIWLNTEINPRANNTGYEYAALDFSRYVANLFGLNLFSIRVVPIVFGLASLVFMYRIVNRCHGRQIAVLVTALLATNQVFLVFQHQLIISMVTTAAILFCIDRYQMVDSGRVTARSALIFGFACAFAALHYQIGRYIMLAIVLFWLTRGLGLKERFLPSFDRLWVLDSKNWKWLLAAGAGFTVTLLIFHVKNLAIFFSERFLSPEYAEHASGIGEAITNFKVNLPLIFHSFLGTSSFYGDHSSDVIASIPYQLLGPPLLALALIGIGALIFGTTDRRYSVFVFFLLFLTTVPIAFSDVIEGGAPTTLSPYRMLYILIPLYLLIAAGADWMFTKLTRQNRLARRLAVAFILAFIGIQTVQYLYEADRFRDYIAGTHCDFQQSSSLDGLRKYRCEPPLPVSSGVTSENLDFHISQFRHYEDQLPYWSYAQQLSERIEGLDLPSDVALVIDAPLTDFESRPVQTHYLGYNFHQVLLAFYLSEHGVDVNYFVPYPGDAPLSTAIVLRNTILVHLTELDPKFPLRLDIDSGVYAAQESSHFKIRTTSSIFSASRIYLVTTEEEKSQAIRHIQELGEKHLIIEL